MENKNKTKAKSVYQGGMYDENKECIMHYVGNTFEEDLEIHYSVLDICRKADKSHEEYVEWLDTLKPEVVKDEGAAKLVIETPYNFNMDFLLIPFACIGLVSTFIALRVLLLGSY